MAKVYLKRGYGHCIDCILFLTKEDNCFLKYCKNFNVNLRLATPSEIKDYLAKQEATQ